jgi:hypothetical protein
MQVCSTLRGTRIYQLNFRAWRARSYSFLLSIYEGLLIHAHMAIALLLIVVTGADFSLFNIILMSCFIFFVFYMHFIKEWPYRAAHVPTVRRFYKGVSLYLFFVLVVYSLIKVPYVMHYI